MQEHFSKNRTHILFVITVVLKGINGTLELIGSILLFTSGEFTKLIIILTQHELGQDPNDFVANHILEYLPYFSLSTQFFAAWYFLIHGITNIILVISLLRKKLWAYPVAMVVQGLFVVYQLYRYTHTHSTSLILLSIFDLILIWFIWREYQRIKKLRADILLP